MSSYEKIVKLACKPKQAAPKSKYLEPIIAATWSEDGAVGDVCKALSPRFREPNSVVVFKALLVLHTMIRNGATDNVLSYLSSYEVLRLKNVSGENWEGYDAPHNLKAYATYLDTRIRSYRDLKHDPIRVQSDSNRDMRSSTGFEEEPKSKPPLKQPSRSKTITGRKLRVMTVEKGLLRETKVVHRMIDSLVQCRLYLDNLEDELIVSALRMLVKDLLILFQAGNEGVINILEHYFEMSHVDAKDALALYRKFCKQTEQVVEYLAIARKLQNILNVSVPNLRHAPVSLAGALQEYLDDANFEQNRIEYKVNKESVNKSGKNGSTKPSKSQPEPTPSSSSSIPSPSSVPSSSTAEAKQPVKQDVIDFFSAIEEEQTPIFNGQPSPNINITQFQQPQVPSAPNPFVQRQMFTGQPMMQQTTSLPMNAGFAPNPFALSAPQSLQPQSTGHRPFSAFLPSQPTGPAGFPNSQFIQPGFLQPQPTGPNPFRQSMLLPNSTGMPLATPGSIPILNQNGPLFSSPALPTNSSNWASPAHSQAPVDVPTRPSSTPLTSISSIASPPEAQPVKKHITGTKNPFGPVVTAPPPVPKIPTLLDIMTGANSANVAMLGLSSPSDQQPVPQQQPTQSEGSGAFNFSSSALNPGRTDISSIASSFAFDKEKETSTSPMNAGAALPSASFPSLPDFSKFSISSPPSSAQSPPASSFSSQPGFSGPPSSQPITSQTTGMSGLKAFKPSSSFGAALLESLPPSAPAGNASAPPSLSTSPPPQNPSSQFPAFSSQPTGLPAGSASTIGVGLRPQMTGGGAANPFRVSNVPPMPGQAPLQNNTAQFGAFGGMPTGTAPFGTGSSIPFTGQPQ